MAEDLPVVLGSDARVQPFGDDVRQRLIDDLVFDAQERVGTKNSGWLWQKEFAGIGRLKDAAVEAVFQVPKKRGIGSRIGRIQLSEVRLVRAIRVRSDPLPCACLLYTSRCV